MEKPKIQTETYEGPTPAAAALGEGKLYGWLSGYIGGTIGAITSGYFIKEEGSWARLAKEAMAKVKIDLKGKYLLMAGGFFAGKWATHFIGLAYGAPRGWMQGERAKQQFDQLKAERDEARVERDALKPDKKFTDNLAPAANHIEQATAEKPVIAAPLR